MTRHARPGKTSPWLLFLLARKLAAVALAHKMARTVWAMMTSGDGHRQPRASIGAVLATLGGGEHNPLLRNAPAVTRALPGTMLKPRHGAQAKRTGP